MRGQPESLKRKWRIPLHTVIHPFEQIEFPVQRELLLKWVYFAFPPVGRHQFYDRTVEDLQMSAGVK
jgi:hypothetical protein